MILFCAVILLGVLIALTESHSGKRNGGNGGASSYYFNREDFPDYRLHCLDIIRVDVNRELEKQSAFDAYSWRAIAAIIIHETGWLSHPDARLRVTTYHNVLGLDKPEGGARQFASYAACFAYFAALMFNKRYDKRAYPVRGTGDEFLTALHDCGYNANESWLNAVLAIYYGEAQTLPD